MRRTAIVVGGLLLAAAGCTGDDGPTGEGAAPPGGEGAAPPGGEVPIGEWVQVTQPPLEPRSQVVGVWTGDQVLFVGGDRFLCPPDADCTAPDEPPFADGATVDVETGEWRSIEPAPVGFSSASTAVIGDDVYFLTSTDAAEPDGPAFLRYSVADDAWEDLPLPDDDPSWYRLVAAGDVVVAYRSSHESGPAADLVFDPAEATWTPLPDSPRTPAYDRSVVWAGEHLYLFDKELVPNPGADRPSLVRASRLDLATGRWERLPDSEILSSGPWVVTGDLLVNPTPGGADGGEVGNWGRSYPNGGVLDATTGTWQPLPDATSVPPDELLASDHLVVDPTLLVAYDPTTGRFASLPPIPNSPDGTRRNVVAAGRHAVTFGGEAWLPNNPNGALLPDAWLWRSG